MIFGKLICWYKGHRRGVRVNEQCNREVVVLPRRPRAASALEALPGQDAGCEYPVYQVVRPVPAVELLLLPGDRIRQRELVARGH